MFRHGLMVIVMKAASKMVNKKVKVFIHMVMKVNGLAIIIKAASKIICITVMELMNMLMVQSTLVNGLMIKKKVKVLWNTLMVIVLKASSKMTNYSNENVKYSNGCKYW